MNSWKRFALTVALLASTGLISLAAATTADDAKKLQGTWILVSGEENGRKLDVDEVRNSKMVIKGDEHDVRVGVDTYVGTHKIDSSKTPKQIDNVDTDGKMKGKTLRGIYELEGDTLKVCLAMPDAARPGEFKAATGSNQNIYVWKQIDGQKKKSKSGAGTPGKKKKTKG